MLRITKSGQNIRLYHVTVTGGNSHCRCKDTINICFPLWRYQVHVLHMKCKTKKYDLTSFLYKLTHFMNFCFILNTLCECFDLIGEGQQFPKVIVAAEGSPISTSLPR